MKRFAIRINDTATSKREKDENGFLIIRDNPIAKAGVFDYLLSEVNGSKDDDIVKVCRTFEDISSKKDMFKGKPIKLSHKWVGDETNHADGAIFGDIKAEEPYLVADLIIYNPELIKVIESGEIVELSPGYEATFIEESGSYDGERYEFKQDLQSVNHLAVVENGRSGNDLRIQDEKINIGELDMNLKDFLNKLTKVADSLPDVKDEDKVRDSDTIKSEIMDIAMKDEEGKEEKLQALIDELSASKAEDSDEEVKDEDKEEVKDNEEVANNIGDNDDVSEAEVIEKLEAIIEKVTDAKIARLKKAVEDSENAKVKAYKEVSQVIGNTFDYAGKSESEIYAFGYECLSGQKVADGLDAVIAFRVVSGSKAKVVDTKTTDSKTDSKILSMLSKY